MRIQVIGVRTFYLYLSLINLIGDFIDDRDETPITSGSGGTQQHRSWNGNRYSYPISIQNANNVQYLQSGRGQSAIVCGANMHTR